MVAASAALAAAIGAREVSAQLPLPCGPLLQPPLCMTPPPAPAHPPAAAAPAAPEARAGAKPASSGASATATPRSAPASGALTVTGVIDDPALKAKVVDVLQHPISSERPSLLHFAAPVAAGTHRAGTTGSGGDSSTAVGVTAVAILTAALLAALIVITRRSQRSLRVKLPRPRLPWLGSRTRQVTAVGALLPAAILLVGLTAPSASRTASDPRVPMAIDAVDVSADVSALPAQVVQMARASGWPQLVSIEQRLDRQRRDLTTQEAAVTRITGDLQREGPSSPRSPDLISQLQQTVGLHQVTATVYQQLLQNEYQFFEGAAQSPPQRQQLVATAMASGQPDAGHAVQHNLDVVQAQHDQEAALSVAEAQAPSSGGDPLSALLHAAGRPTLISPMGGYIEQGFGPTSLSIEPPVSRNGQFYAHFHTGIDISAPEGTPVHAAAPGRVILATASVDDSGQLIGYGRYVAISHGGGFTTIYGHMESIGVHVGQIVQAGDVIGHEGSTGNSTGPHLHFETRVNGSPVDPAPYLRGALHLR